VITILRGCANNFLSGAVFDVIFKIACKAKEINQIRGMELKAGICKPIEVRLKYWGGADVQSGTSRG